MIGEALIGIPLSVFVFELVDGNPANVVYALIAVAIGIGCWRQPVTGGLLLLVLATLLALAGYAAAGPAGLVVAGPPLAAGLCFLLAGLLAREESGARRSS